MSKLEINIQMLIAKPNGFCAGVNRAIKIFEEVLKIHKPPIYIFNELVHNKYVTKNIKKKGGIFIKKLNEIPRRNIIIFSAHGVSKKIEKDANNLDLIIYDATCPLVKKIHIEVKKMIKKNLEIILIGKKGHPEVNGIIGQSDKGNDIHIIENKSDINSLNINSYKEISFVTQSTLSIDDTKEIIAELKKKYPKIYNPKKEDICYATKNRQIALKSILEKCDIIIVVGSKNSSNANRLREIAEKKIISVYMVDSPDKINFNWFIKKKYIGLTASASSPEYLVQDIINHICNITKCKLKILDGINENIIFSLPKNIINHQNNNI